MIIAPLFLRQSRQPPQEAAEKLIFKHRVQQYLQRFVLATKDIPFFRNLYSALYRIAAKLFVFFTLRAERELGIRVLEAIYLRRGVGRGELVLGASDLDFFVVLKTVSAQQEMHFLQLFWKNYSVLRNIFPFLGETLMGDRNELENWMQTGCVRAFETEFSWKCLHGADVLASLPKAAEPELRDIFSEALKCYWSLVQPVLKLQEEQLGTAMKPNSKPAVLLRHGVKAGLDLFRLHFAMGKSRDEVLRIYALSRSELLWELPQNIYGKQLPSLQNILLLRRPVFQSQPTEALAEMVYAGFRCLDDIASRLDAQKEETVANHLVYHALKSVSDPYSLSVRELFAERILFRHRSIVSGCVLSEATAQMYFRLKEVPAEPDFAELLADLRNVSFSLERFNVPMPLSAKSFRQMEKTSLLDSPFHSFYSHREEFISEEGEIKARDYPSPTPEIPLYNLRKTFSELSFALRMQPSPDQFEHFVEKLFTIVLSLRIAVEKGEIVTSFRSALEHFASRYPTRHAVLQKQISPFFTFESDSEKKFWEETLALLGTLEQSQPGRAAQIRTALSSLQAAPAWAQDVTHRTTDLWINLTPFLRMEMNAVKDRLFPSRPVLKL